MQSELDIDTIRTVLSEYRIANADITVREDATVDDLIDVVEGNRLVMMFPSLVLDDHSIQYLFHFDFRVYIPCIYLLNKIDQISIEVGLHNLMS